MASKGKKKAPYRESKLTKLLKNALGGNSKTILLAAISPSSLNYNDTMTTLRFADRAKELRTKAKINISDQEKLIQALKNKIKNLQKGTFCFTN